MQIEKLWHAKEATEVARILNTNINEGLRTLEAEKRHNQYGDNVLPRGKRLRPHTLFFQQFKNPLIFILVVAVFLTAWLEFYSAESHRTDIIVISLAILVNVLIGFWQEWRSSNIFEKLRRLVAVRTRVLRGGKLFEIDASGVVVGDIIILHGGVKVPADARIFEAENFFVNESLLTGESGEIKKGAHKLNEDITLGDRGNMVHMGSTVEQGMAKAIVTGIGKDTEIGRIAELTATTNDEETPLSERLARLGKRVAIFILIASGVIFVAGLFEGRPFSEMFTIVVAVIVAAIPEGLPAALSVVLAVAANRIFKQKGLVKKLIGAETLGSATVILTDKTGTLTEGLMEVDKVLWGDQDKTGNVLALANSAIIEEVGAHAIRGEETDQAKMRWFLKSGGDIKALLKKRPRTAMLEFDSDNKYLASFHSPAKGLSYIAVSGAPEVLIEKSTLKKSEKIELAALVESYAAKGYRVIAAAERSVRSSIDGDSDTATLHGMIEKVKLVGIVALRDPIRPDVSEVIKEARGAGIRTIMATGDHKLTAIAIGQELGFSIKDNAVLLGEDIDKMSDVELQERIGEVSICARVSPAHKMRLVHALKEKGEVVAMTGDGVNDAPAVKAADIGIAFNSGSDATKEVAELVLIDNSFTVIAAAIRQGRIAFDNIRKVTVFLLANSFTEIILVLGALILRVPLPITAVQILWANLVEDGLPNFALAFEHGEPDIMQRRPLARKEPILNKESLVIVFIIGITADLILFGVYLYLITYTALAIEYIRTVIFSMLATNALIYVFSVKSLGRSILKTNLFDNTYLLFAVASGLSIMVASIYFAPLQALLGTVAIGPAVLAAIFGMGFVQLGLIEFVKWIFYHKAIRARFK